MRCVQDFDDRLQFLSAINGNIRFLQQALNLIQNDLKCKCLGNICQLKFVENAKKNNNNNNYNSLSDGNSIITGLHGNAEGTSSLLF